MRIIPAYAGKRKEIEDEKNNIKDHPRLRGEKMLDIPQRIAALGSSPLTRGKAQITAPADGWSGIIPAYAGKRLKKVIKSF